MSNSVGSTVSNQADYGSISTQPSRQTSSYTNPSALSTTPDTFSSSSNNNKRKTGIIWILGGLAAGVAALALFKKDGESLLKLIFRSSRKTLPQTTQTESQPLARTVDETLLDHPEALPAELDMSGALEELQQLGRGGRFSQWRAMRATRKNQKKLGEAGYLNMHLTTGDVQADAMINAQMAGERYAQAHAKCEAARVKFLNARNEYRHSGRSVNASRKYEKAREKYWNTAAALRTETEQLKVHMDRLRQANKEAAKFGN